MANVGSTFDTSEPLLSELLRSIGIGDVQLPDFQRGWIWDDEHIRALLASVSLSYPIGAIMLLETGGDGVRFRPRPIEGVTLRVEVAPKHLVLDGQQRLTSLYLALCGEGPVRTTTDRGTEIERIYYLSMAGCLDPDQERLDSILSLPPDRVVRTDFARQVVLDVSTPEREYHEGMVPARLLFDSIGFDKWKDDYREYWGYDRQRIEELNRFSHEVWQGFLTYKVPIISLLKGTAKEAVCQVFEKVNTGGVPLSVFELMTATFATEDFSLKDDWDARRQRLSHATLNTTDETAFLTTVTLLASFQRAQGNAGAVSCRRRDVLRLTLPEYQQWADAAERGLVAASKFLVRECVFDSRALPYASQLIPLAAISARLGHRADIEPIRQKLAQWFWCGVFGELYGSALETRFVNDLVEVLAWLDGGEEPRTVRDASFAPLRLLGLQTRNSAAYKGLVACLISAGARDFLSGEPIQITNYFDDAVDIHHVFPERWCMARGLDRRLWNSVVNKTPLSSRTNRILGGRAPSEYLASLSQTHGIATDRLDEAVLTHRVDAALLRADAFLPCLRDRAIRLLDLIEEATGKPVTGRDTDEVKAAFGGDLLSNGVM